MGGGKGKNKKRKNNEGEPMSPPPPEGYRSGGVLPTPSPTPSVATTTAALQQVTIEEETETAGYWKQKCEVLLELNGLITVQLKDYPLVVQRLEEEKKKVEGLEAEVGQLKRDFGIAKMMIAGRNKSMLAHEKGMEQILAAIDEFVPDPESWESFDCPASGVVHGINRLYDMWK